MALPKNAHDYAVAEARMKTFVTLAGEYFKLTKDNRVVVLSPDDRAFLIEQGVLAEEDSDAD